MVTKRFKIAYVTGRFPSVSTVFQQNEILGIIAAGAEVRVLSCRKTSPQEISSIHDFARPILKKVVYPNYRSALRSIVFCLVKHPSAVATNIIYLMLALVNPLAFPKVMAAFLSAFGWYHILQRENYEWIHADFGMNTATTAMMLSKLLNCGFSYKVHAADIYNKSFSHCDQLSGVKFQQADVVFAVNEYGRKIYAESLGNHHGKIKINYGSVRTEDFKPLAPVLDSKRFVALGRLVPKKGFNILVEAAAILRDRGENFIVDIYGGGQEEQLLRRIIQEKSLHKLVNIKGVYDNGKIPEILSDCLALIVPSIMDKHCDMDGVPTVVYEAMALGRSVIASRISGIPEIVHDGSNGYLVEPGDAFQLCGRMNQFLKDPESCFAMGEEGRRLAEKNHNYIHNAKELLESLQ